MRDFEIFTDACSDLPVEFVEKKKLQFARLTCTYNGQTYYDDFGQSLSHKKFFDDLRNGATPFTSQPSVDEFYRKFKAIVQEGKDILYICVSTGLSGTENSANIAKGMIAEENPEAKICIVNVLTASLGQGICVIKAFEMKEQGKTLDEIANHFESTKQKLNTFMTVDDLNHLKRGGRLSSAAAIIGIILHIKPMLRIDREGKVGVLGKARGRKNSITQLAQLVIERIENPEDQILGICHGDCIEEALKLKELILEKVKFKDVLINYTGPAVGTHGGPGNLAVFFIGKDKEFA